MATPPDPAPATRPALGPAHPVQARRVAADGTRGPVIDVSEPGERAFNARVGADQAGNATVVWERPAGPDWIVRARRITAAGALEAARDLSSLGDASRLPRVAVDPSGTATVLWRTESAADIVRARRIDPAGAPGPVLDMSETGDVAGHEVAVAPTGRAFAVWSRLDGAAHVVEGRAVDAAGTPGTTLDLSAAGVDAFVSGLTVDAAGDATVVWDTAGHAVQARRIAATGSLGPIEDVAPGDDPQVAADPSGGATVVWQGSGHTVELRRIGAGGALGGVRTLSTGGENETPFVDVDGAGVARVVWRSSAGTADALRSRGAPPDGTLEPEVDVAAPREEVDAPRLAGDAAGNAVAVWNEWDGTRYVVAGARFTAPPVAATGPAADPVPTVSPGPALLGSCSPVALRSLRTDASRPPRSRRRRVKGVAARVSLTGSARLELIAATLSHRRGRVRLAGRRTVGRTLRLALPARLARTLPVGRRVTLRMRLRAAGARCPFGPARTLTLRTSVVWIPTTGGRR